MPSEKKRPRPMVWNYRKKLKSVERALVELGAIADEHHQLARVCNADIERVVVAARNLRAASDNAIESE